MSTHRTEVWGQRSEATWWPWLGMGATWHRWNLEDAGSACWVSPVFPLRLGMSPHLQGLDNEGGVCYLWNSTQISLHTWVKTGKEMELGAKSIETWTEPQGMEPLVFVPLSLWHLHLLEFPEYLPASMGKDSLGFISIDRLWHGWFTDILSDNFVSSWPHPEMTASTHNGKRLRMTS